MESQRYGLVLAWLLIVALGIFGVPVTADYSPGSGAPLQMADNFTTPDPAIYTLSELSELPSGYAGPILMIVNSTSAGQTLYTVPAPTDNSPGSGDPLQRRGNLTPPDLNMYPVREMADDPPDLADIFPVPESAMSRTIFDGAPVSGESDSISPGDSLQAAIDAAADGDTIYLDPGTYYEYGIIISKNITIRTNESAGGNRDNTIIDAMELDTIFYVVNVDSSFTIDNLTLRKGYGWGAGGAIYNLGSLNISNSTITNCRAGHSGGAIYSSDSNVTISSSSFSNCSADFGGTIYNTGGTLNIITSSFSNSWATASGGAILSTNSNSVTIASSSFFNCSTIHWGGAIYSSDSNVTISSSSFSHCSATTGYGGAIYTDAGTSLYITTSSFSSCSADLGGAIFFFSGTVNVRSSTFSDCTSLNGGAINSNSEGILTVNSSTFTNCSSNTGGAIINFGIATIGDNSVFTGCSAVGAGAVYNGGSSLTITDSAFSGCFADYTGGAVSSSSGTLTISTTSFSECTADYYSGAIYSYGGPFNISGSTFSDCSAGQDGGAIFSLTPIIITTTSFNNCSALYGGAVITFGVPLTISSSLFENCSADLVGGAVSSENGALIISNTSFSNCSADSGGAIRTLYGTFNVITSTFSVCSGRWGGAILSAESTGTIHFSRFYQNTATDSGKTMYASSMIDATNNWWGSNADPSPQVWGPVTTSPWLVLGITADPSSITLPQTSYIRTNLTYNSDGTDTSGGGIFVPDAITNTYALVSGPGVVAPVTSGTTNGAAQTTYITLQPGTTTIAGTVDAQTVYITLDVAQGTWTPSPTVVPNFDDGPAAVTGSSAAGGAAATGASGFPLMTVTVNIGGDSKAWQAVVTGTKLSELIVTGTVQHDVGSNMTAPPGVIFQYISLVPARYHTITNAVINFTVPQSWLDENHIAPGNIVLYHQTANGWEALPTKVLYTKDGTVYFSAVSPGFSLFAIAGTPAAATPPVTATASQGIMNEVVQTPVTDAGTYAPVTMQTTAAPAPQHQPVGSTGFPFMIAAMTGVGCIVLLSGGMLVRNWWIRRQNPALFRDYD